jgi:hypothetical protein
MSVYLLPVNALVFGNLVLIKASRALKRIAVSTAKRKSGTMKASGLILRLVTGARPECHVCNAKERPCFQEHLDHVGCER